MLEFPQAKAAHIEHRLRTDPIIWFCSTRRDGRPHAVPVWFLWDGTSFLLLSRPDSQKLRNIRDNRQVSLLLDGTNEGRDVVILEGSASLAPESALRAALPAFSEKYQARMLQMKWSIESLAADHSQAVSVIPTRFVQMEKRKREK